MTSVATLPEPTELLAGQDIRVPLRNGRTTRPINFDHAASTPAFLTVRQRVNAFLDW